MNNYYEKRTERLAATKNFHAFLDGKFSFEQQEVLGRSAHEAALEALDIDAKEQNQVPDQTLYKAIRSIVEKFVSGYESELSVLLAEFATYGAEMSGARADLVREVVQRVAEIKATFEETTAGEATENPAISKWRRQPASDADERDERVREKGWPQQKTAEELVEEEKNKRAASRRNGWKTQSKAPTDPERDYEMER